MSLHKLTRTSNLLRCQEGGRTGLGPPGANSPAAGEETVDSSTFPGHVCWDSVSTVGIWVPWSGKVLDSSGEEKSLREEGAGPGRGKQLTGGTISKPSTYALCHEEKAHAKNMEDVREIVLPTDSL